MEIGYNKKMIRKQILNAPEHSRNDLLEKEKQGKANIQHHLLPSFFKVLRV